MVIVFLFAAQRFSTHTAASARPESPVEIDDPVAMVKSILVNGVEQEQANTSELKVTRPSVPEQAGQAGMQLIAGDEVSTGPNAKVTLLFLDGAPEKDNEVLVESNSRIRIGSAIDLWGKILVRSKGDFQTISPKMRLDSPTAEYEVDVQPDGTNRLRVIEGSVSATTGNFVRLMNPEDLDQIAGPTIDRNAVKFAHTTSNPQQPSVSLQIGVPVLKLEQVVVSPVGTPLKNRASIAEIDETLNWSNPVIESSQPSYSAESIVPRWQTSQERRRAFRAARRDAVLTGNPRAYATLGDVYVDWGNGAKAIDELRIALAAEQTPQGLTSLGEAFRLMGNLQQAETILVRTVRQYPNFAAGFNALGNVYKERAKVAQDRRDYASATQDLRSAKDQYQRAQQNEAVNVIAQTNSAESDLALGDIAREQGRNDEALAQYRQAEQSFTQAGRTSPAYPFVPKGLGDVYRGIGLVALANRDIAQARDSLNRSQQRYTDAIRANTDFAEAYVGLGNLYEDVGRRDLARTVYQAATRVRPESRLAHYHLALALVDTNPRLAASNAVTYQKLEPGVFRQGERFRRAQVLIDTVRRGGGGGGPTPTPIPTATRSPTSVPSPGNLTVKVPGVNGNRPDEAIKKLKDKGLTGEIREQGDCKATGKVTSTSPKKDEKVAAGSVVIVFVSSAGENAVPVPQVTRRSLREAEQQLRNAGLDAKVERREETNSVEENTVLRQDPQANTRLKQGCSVDLTVSVRIQLVQVPNYVGISRQEAFQQLSRFFGTLVRGNVIEVDSRYPPGTVVSQSPSAGEMVPKGTRVNLAISRSQPVDTSQVVPNFIGRSLSEVSRYIESTRGALRLGQVSRRTDNSRKAETVISQSPQPNSRVPAGTTINLVVTVPERIN
jgi:beta-lactam-binding protein with PASTA domain/tetratricopeptide (TPR) repeat protein